MSPRSSSLACLVTLWVTAAACSVYDPSLLESDVTRGETSSGGATGVSTTTGETSNTGGESTSAGGSPTPDDTTTTTTTNTATSGGGTAPEATESSGSGGSGGSSDTSTTSSGIGGTVGNDCEYIDCCPNDPNKMSPGQCGCEVADTDTDGDGSADCVDECPEDESKTAPGVCGCGVPDEDGATGVSCAPLDAALLHRYSFDGTGAAISDGRGSSHGTLVNASLDGSGSVTLNDGSDDQYVELPSGLLSSLTSASIEAWFVWEGGPMWTRLFDFGSTVEGVAGEPGTGKTFVLFTPRGPDGPDCPYATFYNGDAESEALCSGTETLTSGETHHVVVSLDAENARLELYLDGELSCSQAMVNSLDTLDDVNSWIGRSQFSSDALFVGSVDEFRIYDMALSAEQVAFSLEQGPDPTFLDD